MRTNEAQNGMDNGKKVTEGRTRRTRPLPGMARRLAELAAQIEETARAEDERDREAEGKIREILLRLTGGGIEHMIRGMNLTDEERNFMRQQGWKV